MSWNSIMRKLMIAVTALTLGSMAAIGQHTTATVNGTVTDSSGSVVPGASVVLTNVDTRVAARAASNGSGYFAFVDVTPGRYAMTVTMRGSRK